MKDIKIVKPDTEEQVDFIKKMRARSVADIDIKECIDTVERNRKVFKVDRENYGDVPFTSYEWCLGLTPYSHLTGLDENGHISDDQAAVLRATNKDEGFMYDVGWDDIVFEY